MPAGHDPPSDPSVLRITNGWWVSPDAGMAGWLATVAITAALREADRPP